MRSAHRVVEVNGRMILRKLRLHILNLECPHMRAAAEGQLVENLLSMHKALGSM